MQYDKKELISQLTALSKAFTDWYLNKPIEQMNAQPEGAWTAGQHLLHMIKSTKPLAVGMGYPRILLRLKFGKVSHASRSYEEVVRAYQDALHKGGKAPKDFVPRDVKKEERDVLIKRFKKEMGVLTNQVHQWSEKNLDNTAVPHPLIGKLTLREMLYFTIYHTEHHLKTLEEKYS